MGAFTGTLSFIYESHLFANVYIANFPQFEIAI